MEKSETITSLAKGINKVKPGGVGHIEGQESALRLTKEILE